MHPPTLLDLHDLLVSPVAQSLLRLHPNDLATDTNFHPPPPWQSWWDWPPTIPGSDPDDPPAWIRVVRAHIDLTHVFDDVPPPLSELVRSLTRLQLTRSPIVIDAPLRIVSEKGMSPKKIHEVSRMATYIVDLIRINHLDPAKIRIVDIGAGQGYLTRILKYHLPSTHILALDADEGQILGAQRWEERVLPKAQDATTPNPPISHRTILISSDTLKETVDDWVTETLQEKEQDPVSVLMVALHACGSLTPDIFRAFISSCRSCANTRWTPFGVVAIGCCYNLMNPGDFPLSQCLLSQPKLNLPPSAYHLAAQIPHYWLDSSLQPNPSVALSVRKVAWRAFLGRELLRIKGRSSTEEPANETPPPGASSPAITLPSRQHTVPARWARPGPSSQPPSQNTETPEGTGDLPLMRRLGRLRDSAYDSWDGFLTMAGEKTGVDFQREPHENGSQNNEKSAIETSVDRSLERRVELLHTLRCLLGPVVESAILLDRLTWVREELGADGDTMNVDLVNLFDQATGSGRNVGIVVAPLLPS